MPYYTYKCEKCEKEDYEIREVEKRNEPKKCNCGGAMKLKIGNPPFKIKGGK